MRIPEKKKSTYDFYKNTKRDLFFQLHDEEISKLIDYEGNIKNEYSDPIGSCPICKEKKFEFQFKKQGFNFKKCVNCSHIYVDPQINEQALSKAYTGGDKSASDVWMDVLLSSDNQEYDLKKYNVGLDLISKYLSDKSPNPNILDIGCSIGLFLNEAKKRNWNCFGLELNTRAVDHAKKKFNLDVRRKLLTNSTFSDNFFDVITMWGVIEHLKDPVSVLRTVKKKLKKDGIFLTFCPNAMSLVCRVIQSKATCFDGHDHPQNFSPCSIKFLLKKLGFKNLFLKTYQPDLDPVLNHISGLPPYIKDKTDHKAINLLPKERSDIENFLSKNLLGYKMMTVSRKV